MTDEPKHDPASRMRALLGENQEGQPVDEKGSPLTRLPRKSESPSLLPGEDPWIPPSLPEALQTAPVPAPPAKRHRLNFGPPFWTITGILSLVVNVVLIVALVSMLVNLRSLKVVNLMGMTADLLGGMYTNFERMDRAHITAAIPVQTTIPVKFDLQLNQQTNVVLSQDVTIDDAVVTVKTGGLNITNAVTTIVLPAGTNLPVVLNLTVPVDTTVPVTLQVPVDIPIEQTDLHVPFNDLRSAVQPFYCLVDRDAVNLDGQAICP
jgi:hypothetical protein